MDTDELNYSVATLRQWKAQAEQRAHLELVGPGEFAEPPTTLVSFGFDVVVDAVWSGGDASHYVFDIIRFVHGDQAALAAFAEASAELSSMRAFIAVESQGDARAVNGEVSWQLAGSAAQLRVNVPVAKRPIRRSPLSTGPDLRIGAFDDLELDSTGDLATIDGIDAAKQQVHVALSTTRGESYFHPEMGTRWRDFAEHYSSDLKLLARLFLLDAARLISISDEPGCPPLLSCVERLERVDVISVDLAAAKARVRVSLLWATTGERWETEFNAFLGRPSAS